MHGIKTGEFILVHGKIVNINLIEEANSKVPKQICSSQSIQQLQRYQTNVMLA